MKIWGISGWITILFLSVFLSSCSKNVTMLSYEGNNSTSVAISETANLFLEPEGETDNAILLKYLLKEENHLDFLDENFNMYMSDISVGETFELCYAGAVLKICRIDDEMLFDGIPKWYLISIKYSDMEKNLSEPMALNGNFKISAFSAGEYFVFEKVYYNWADGFIFTKDEIIDITSNFDAEFSLSFFKGEDNRLMFRRMDKKYTSIQSDDIILETITSRQQFYSEEGSVAIDNGIMELNPEVTYTLTDYMAWNGTSLDEWYFSTESRKFDTIDQLIEMNKDKTK